MMPLAILGLGSRYSYLAATRIDALEADCDTRFDIWPVHSPDLIAAAHGGVSPFAAPVLRGQYDPAYRDRDARRWAQHYDVPYDPPKAALESRDMAYLCWSYSDRETRRSLAFALMRMIFAEARAPNAAGLAELRDARGVPDRDGATAHAEAVAAALAAGVFGVPSFVIGAEVFWGNDRLPLVRRALIAARTGGNDVRNPAD